MFRRIVGFLGKPVKYVLNTCTHLTSKILNLIKTKMKNKKIRIAGYVLTGTLIVFSAFSVFAANWTAPSRLELAEAIYKESMLQLDYWTKKQKEDRCNLASIKVAEHIEMKLGADELQRLSGVLGECEGK